MYDRANSLQQLVNEACRSQMQTAGTVRRPLHDAEQLEGKLSGHKRIRALP